METAIIGKNAKRIRLASDLTKADIAGKAGISISAYSKMESGDTIPRVDTLYKIAKAMGVEIQELLSPVRELTAVRFRAHKKLKKRDDLLAKTSRWLDDFNYLLGLEDQSAEYTLSGIPHKLKNVERKILPIVSAKEVREQMGLDQEEPIHDITGLLAAHGIKILTYPLASDAFFGMSVSEKSGGPAIVVNVWNRISVERWIFSAAHELGHLLLHLHAYNVEVIEEDEQEEKEADIFAAHFLMPEKGFEKEWRETSGLSLWDRILKVKRIYHVSYKTVLYRLVELRVFETDVWQKANAFLKKRYPNQRISKIFEPEKLQEYDFVTDWLDRIVRVAVENDMITLNRASEILDVSLQEVRQRASSWAEEKVAARS
jgi:Zn-dependent peptidase ImmA (M78 family)/DNA-binding XRE family transcriptional regulator